MNSAQGNNDGGKTSNTDPSPAKTNNDSDKAQTGSKSDPQKTELDGLKKGGVEPNVHPEDKGHGPDGKDD